jgi:EpsI family protein
MALAQPLELKASTALQRRLLGLLLAVTLVAALSPTYAALARDSWPYPSGSHGPLILAASALLVWRDRAWLQWSARDGFLPGVVLFALGLAMYVVGRSQDVIQLDAASQIPLLLGLVLLVCGRATARPLIFPILFLIFLVPIPGSMLDQITLPLKQNVSQLVVAVLHAAGLPIARSGVVLYVGHYQLLLADACSGLNSMISLSGLGLLYVNLAKRRAPLTDAILVASALPVAFAANVLRVGTLVLLTYYCGDAVGREFHSWAGYAEIAFAFAAFFLVDRALIAASARFARKEPSAPAEPPLPESPIEPRVRLVPAIAASVAILSAAGAAFALTPTPREATALPDLGTTVPAAFGAWTGRSTVGAQVDVAVHDGEGGRTTDSPYDQVLMRTYVDHSGNAVLLAIAYGRSQRQEVKIHRPELCYVAQGFEVVADEPAQFNVAPAGEPIPGRRIVAHAPNHSEAVSYWIRIGSAYSSSAWKTRLQIVRDGLNGQVPDGILVRVSSRSSSGDPTAQFALHEAFMRDLLRAMPASDNPLLTPPRTG